MNKTWTRRQALWLMAGATGSVGLHACVPSGTTSLDSTSRSSNLVPATFGINPWIGQAPLHIAKAKGFFQEAGLDLSIRAFATNLESVPAFLVGRLEGCTAMPSSEVVTMASQGGNFRIVGVMDLSSGGDAILARNSISDIQSFKGKQVAVQKGGLGHFFLLQVLEEVGLGESDISILDSDPEVAARAYEAGNVEIAYTYSPFLEKANASQSDGRIIYDTSQKPTAIIDLNLVTTEFAETYPEAVQAFSKGIFKAQEFLKTNPDEAYAIVAEPLGLQPNEVGEQLKGVLLPDLETHSEMLNNPQSDLYLLDALSAMAEFQKTQGQIDTVPDLASFIDPQFLDIT
ncbi:ABC transporter substrate-binding protein [Oculatella sp. LEGE 06141]|uniref:ABC transporter substrate-binding protein n=1 Tax=Oculatella sp. LEGE 06141 TaxID=1828648 RepID=UPI00188043CC|nr:ABC transporter substrate-binding protein [Oculatella sp. LEGE 06141]MBE9178009.1 ABC transporter substrate-binding protein [Oculatella sp. LEGE 06141]